MHLSLRNHGDSMVSQASNQTAHAAEGVRECVEGVGNGDNTRSSCQGLDLPQGRAESSALLQSVSFTSCVACVGLGVKTDAGARAMHRPLTITSGRDLWERRGACAFGDSVHVAVWLRVAA